MECKILQIFVFLALVVSLAQGQACGIVGGGTEFPFPVLTESHTGLIETYTAFNSTRVEIQTPAGVPAGFNLNNYIVAVLGDTALPEYDFSFEATANFPDLLETIWATSLTFTARFWCKGAAPVSIQFIITLTDENNNIPTFSVPIINLNAYLPYNPLIPLNFDPNTGFTALTYIDCDFDEAHATPQITFQDEGIFTAVHGAPTLMDNCHVYNINIYLARQMALGFYRTGISISDGAHAFTSELNLRIESYPYDSHICSEADANEFRAKSDSVCRVEGVSSAYIFDPVRESLTGVLKAFNAVHIRSVAKDPTTIPNLDRYLTIGLIEDAEDPTRDQLVFTRTDNWDLFVEETRSELINLMLNFVCDDSTTFWIHFQIPIVEENTNAPELNRNFGALTSYRPFNEFIPLNFLPDPAVGFTPLQITDCDFLEENTAFTLSSEPDILSFGIQPAGFDKANCHVFNVNTFLKEPGTIGSTQVTVSLTDGHADHGVINEELVVNILDYPEEGQDGICEARVFM